MSLSWERSFYCRPCGHTKTRFWPCSSVPARWHWSSWYTLDPSSPSTEYRHGIEVCDWCCSQWRCHPTLWKHHHFVYKLQALIEITSLDTYLWYGYCFVRWRQIAAAYVEFYFLSPRFASLWRNTDGKVVGRVSKVFQVEQVARQGIFHLARTRLGPEWFVQKNY